MQASAMSWLRRAAGFVLVLLVLSALVLGSGGLANGLTKGVASSVLVLRVDGAIGPASADYLARGLKRAAASGAALVVIEIDTPGGLDTSMRSIIKDILASPVPVATFVAPEGARAASAGTYILYASHVAAMAPATNLGAATPVAIGIGGAQPGKPAPDPTPDENDSAEREQTSTAAGKDGKPASSAAAGNDSTRDPAQPAPKRNPKPLAGAEAMTAKSVEDATAYIRSLAQLRGRNADFAERAVREAASLAAEDALAQEVIDVIAVDVSDLLAQLDGREVGMSNGKVALVTAKAGVERIEPDWRNRILATLTNPQVALILMMIGMYGLLFEFTSSGFGVPGVAGAISLLIALYAFQLLPVNWAGVLLLAIGAGLMLGEAFMPSFGVLGVGGIIAFIVGGLFLMDTDAPGFGVPVGLVIGLALASAAVLIAIGGFAARSFKRPVVSGREQLAGAPGTVIGPAAGGGWWVTVHGECWRARSDAALEAGGRVRVDRLQGLVLVVSPLTEFSNQRSISS